LIAPDLVPALAATIGDYTPQGCLAALHAAVDLYRSLRGKPPDIARRTEAETAVVAYLADIEARLERNAPQEIPSS
jgi:hypothetical protein